MDNGTLFGYPLHFRAYFDTVPVRYSAQNRHSCLPQVFPPALYPPLFMYNLKPLNIILLIAIVIAEVLHLKKTFFTRKKSVASGSGNLFRGRPLHCSAKGAETYTRYVADDSKRMPISYYLVLGTDYNTYGAWSAFSASICWPPPHRRKKNAAALSLIKQRFSEAGITGYLHHYINKIHLFYNDGTFGLGCRRVF